MNWATHTRTEAGRRQAAGALEIDAYLHGSYMLRPIQRDLLDHAIYELGDSYGD